ncbi:MAG: polysaccharide biosynthesis C-terminal domain-containing protein, partial [bacterium]
INSEGIIRLFFGAKYVEAASVLILLTAGLSLVTMMAIINTIMIAQNKMKACFVMIAGLLALDVVLGLALVTRFGLMGAATATTLVGIVGTIWGGMYILQDFKGLVFSLSTVRIAGAAALVFLLSYGLNLISLDVIIESALIAGLYLVLLWLTKELNSIDLRRLRESFGIS